MVSQSQQLSIAHSDLCIGILGHFGRLGDGVLVVGRHDHLSVLVAADYRFKAVQVVLCCFFEGVHHRVFVAVFHSQVSLLDNVRTPH